MATVLVVDPDDDFRETVQLVLARARHDARGCRNASEALRLVGAGMRVLVDGERRAAIDVLSQAGARVIPVTKPMSIAELLAALADTDEPS
jgi:DNA-binding NtrC family response regulator